MIGPWPHPNRYGEASKHLRDAIATAAIQDAFTELVMTILAVAHSAADADAVQVSNDHATKIRDDLSAATDESGQP